MNKLAYFWIVTGLALSSTAFSFEGTDLCTSTIQNIESKFEKELKGFNASLLISDSGQIIVNKSIGPNITSDSRFLLASLSKTMAAIITNNLVENHEADFDEKISSTLEPALKVTFPTAWKPITLHNLLSHTSGLVDYLNEVNDSFMNLISTPRSFIEIFSALPKALNFPIYSQLRYSNTNYYLLGHFLEAKTGLTFEKLAEERLFSPLGMGSTSIEHKYTGDFTGDSSVNLSNMDGVGSAVSTATDLMHMLQSLDEPKNPILESSSIARMYDYDPKCGVGKDPAITRCKRYGLGFSIRAGADAVKGHSWYFHSGHFRSVSSMIAKVPDLKLNYVLLSNKKGVETETFAAPILASLIQNGCVATTPSP